MWRPTVVVVVLGNKSYFDVQRGKKPRQCDFCADSGREGEQRRRAQLCLTHGCCLPVGESWGQSRVSTAPRYTDSSAPIPGPMRRRSVMSSKPETPRSPQERRQQRGPGSLAFLRGEAASRPGTAARSTAQWPPGSLTCGRPSEGPTERCGSLGSSSYCSLG